jgi:hypothetical protein
MEVQAFEFAMKYVESREKLTNFPLPAKAMRWFTIVIEALYFLVAVSVLISFVIILLEP